MDVVVEWKAWYKPENCALHIMLQIAPQKESKSHEHLLSPVQEACENTKSH